MKRLPVVAIMGRPNVGKSTLMNRLSTQMTAIVDPTPGVTRDRKYTNAVWRGRNFSLADTGGLGIDTEGGLGEEIERQAFFAAEEADVLVMLTDVNTGVTGDDEWVAGKLKRTGKKCILAVNKVDNSQLELEVGRFYALGLGDPVAVSAIHGTGTGELLDRIVDALPESGEEPGEPEIAVAIVGRPNVGKSSILNVLSGEYRALVDERPHTTRDSVDTIVECGGTEYRIVDTAGIRRKRKGMPDVDYYSSVRTFRAIDQADVVLLVIDSDQGPAESDQKIARRIDKRGRASIILANKWDLVAEEGSASEVMESIAHKFRFARHLPLLRVSATTGRGMERILPLVDTIYEQYNTRIPTPLLNQFIAEVKERHSPPAKGGKRLKIYYATQVQTAPPTFLFFVNDSGIVNQAYRRFMVNQLREEYGFWGSPLRLRFRTAGPRRKRSV